MKALSLLAPYGLLIVGGEKKVETRDYPPPKGYLGIVAIHHSKRFPDECKRLCEEEPFLSALQRCGLPIKTKGIGFLTQMPLGAVLGFAELYDFAQVVHGDEPERWGLSEKELEFGNFEVGRWCWFLKNPKRYLKPIPARGALGLWNWYPPKPKTQVDIFPLN